MRIGVSCYPTYGGSGVVASELARAMAAAGDEVHVVSHALPPRLAGAEELIHFHQVNVRPYPLFEYPPYSLALATRLVEVARKHQLDVLHVHYAVPHAVSAVLARQILEPQLLPVVTTLHGTDVTLVGNDPSYLETTRYGVVQSDAVTAVSEWLRERTQEQLGIDREIEVIPNFLDPERFNGLGASRSRDGDPVIVHVSNLRKVKRPHDLLEVFLRVREKEACRLRVVGDGPERDPLQEACSERGLSDSVEFLGNLDAVEGVLSDADVFLLPSQQESFGLAALEALACRVPVVGTRVGGLPDVVRHEEWGLLYPVGDIEGMSEGVIRLLRSGSMRREMGERGRAWALERFDRGRIVERYREIYERVAVQGAPA